MKFKYYQAYKQREAEKKRGYVMYKSPPMPTSRTGGHKGTLTVRKIGERRLLFRVENGGRGAWPRNLPETAKRAAMIFYTRGAALRVNKCNSDIDLEVVQHGNDLRPYWTLEYSN